MEVIVLDGDSDEGEHQHTTRHSSSVHASSVDSRPAKRRKQEASTTHVTETTDLSESVSHVSDTVWEPSATEAPVLPAAAHAGEAESPTLSPQQACVSRFWNALHPVAAVFAAHRVQLCCVFAARG